MSSELLSRFEASRLALARTGVIASEHLSRALEQAMTVTAQTLDVARVGVWLFDADETTLRCVCQFDRDRGGLVPCEELDVTHWPRYREAIHSRKCVVAHDAMTDERTAELARDYLVPHGITSMMDAPLFREGRVTGVVCHEHVGPPRRWSERDVDFASSVSDMLTSVFESAARLAAERELAAERHAHARNERMIALGRLAAGIAHDFNGILGATVLAADVFAREAATDELREAARELKTSADVGRRLVSQLLTFARRRPGSPVVLDAREVLVAMTPMLQTLAREKSRLAIETPATPLHVFIDRSQLEQVVMNLVMNALDATPAGKRISVTLREDASGPTRCLEIRVSDEGVGIDPALCDRIFEPFFTTKEESKGSGMGLATVHGIVEQAGGTIGVTSEVGAGATFVVRFPAV